MTLHHAPRRSWRLLALTTAAVTGFSLLAASPATADATATEPLKTISDSGVVSDVASIATPDLAAQSGFAGTGAIGTDGADHGIDLDGTARGGVGIYSVIGTDGRVRETSTTGSVMARSTALLTYEKDGWRKQFCTGWLFGPDTIITAGHCVYNPVTKVWQTSNGQLRAWPGRDDAKTPYGSCTVKSVWTTTEWFQNADRNYDVAAMKLNCTVGNTTGWPGIWYTSASLVGETMYVRGYPADKPYATQWWHAEVATADTTAMRLFYMTDTYNGQSGSPVYSFVVGNCTCVLGIHATGTTVGPVNGGTRITKEIADQLMYWRNM